MYYVHMHNYIVYYIIVMIIIKVLVARTLKSIYHCEGNGLVSQ